MKDRSTKTRSFCATVVSVLLFLPIFVQARPNVQTGEVLERIERAPGAVRKPAIAAVGNKNAGTLRTVSNQPEGYGSVIEWNRADQEAQFVIFINSADADGVVVTNLKPGDTIEVTEADGIASFDDGNGGLIKGIVGAVAVGASLGATTIGAPEAIPFITAGAEFAKNEFGKSKQSKKRDPYG
jgi:hypothetical protein